MPTSRRSFLLEIASPRSCGGQRERSVSNDHSGSTKRTTSSRRYLNGQGVLAAKLRRAVVDGPTRRHLAGARDGPEEERQAVLGQRKLMNHLKSDLSEADYLRARRMLAGSWDNVDKIEVALKAGMTALPSAIAGMTLAVRQAQSWDR